MDYLSACPTDGPSENRKGLTEYWIVDRKGDDDNRRDPLTLIITSRLHEFVVFPLDRDNIEWPTGKRPEAVLIASLKNTYLVCFIELKATMKGDDVAYNKAMDQLLGGARHFCPGDLGEGGTEHGAEHHRRWSSDDDILCVMPDKKHVVMGVAIAFRKPPPRPLPPPAIILSGKSVQRLFIQVPMDGYNKATITLENFCAKLGILLE